MGHERRLKITSDGTVAGTRTRDAETGEALPYAITGIQWTVKGGEALATATLTIENVECEIHESFSRWLETREAE